MKYFSFISQLAGRGLDQLDAALTKVPVPDAMRKVQAVLHTANTRWPYLLDHLAILLLLLSAVYLRIDSLWHWYAHSNIYFFNQLPLILNVDGYYFLDLARSLVEGELAAVNNDRMVPVGVENSQPVPLLAYLTAWIHTISGAPLLWIAVVLPAVVGALLVVPTYLMGREVGGRWLGIVAAAIAALSPHYLQRTAAGWFDTDCLVVTIPMFLAWLSMRFGNTENMHRWWYMLAAAILTLVFLWWWDFGSAPVLMAFVLPASFAMLFAKSLRGQRLVFLAVIIAVAGAIVAIKPVLRRLNITGITDTAIGHG